MPETKSAPAAGFADPRHQSQATFRCLLEAMSRPGRPVELAVAADCPPGVAPWLGAAALALCDFDTPVWLAPGLDRPDIAAWLRFHTGAPLVAAPAEAAFVLIEAAAIRDFSAFRHGTDESPEDGATLLVAAPDLGGPATITCRGPGIRDSILIPSCGLSDVAWTDRARLTGDFPRGVDLYIGAGRRLLGLPRSTELSLPEV